MKNYLKPSTLLLIISLLLISPSAFTQNVKYHFDNNTNEGISYSKSTQSGLTVRHTINNMSIDNLSFKDISGHVINMNEVFLSNDPGKPNLPIISRHIAIPKGASVSINIKNVNSTIIKNIDILPAPEPQLDNDNSEPIHNKDVSIYNNNTFFPENQVSISEKMYIRDVEVVMLSISPFQYNPVTKELIVSHDIEIEFNFEGGDNSISDVRYRSKAWDHIIKDMVLNSDILPEVDYHSFIREAVERNDEGCEYLIICPDNEEFIQLADSIKLFRNQQGILTKVVTVSECGGNDDSSIKDYISNAYHNWAIPPSAVLLMGDHNNDGTQGVVSHTMYNHIEPSYNPYISDNAYGDINNDHLPDIIIARITGRNYEEMYHMINKGLSYERQPPTSYKFYNNPITAMGFQLERWFQLCSEIVGGFWRNAQGKEPVRQNAIYDGTPGSLWSTYEKTNTVLAYFGPNGLEYVPGNMSHLTEWDATSTTVNNAINSGAFILQHRDHGGEELWGEPSYSISSIQKLTNKDLTFVMSNNCLTGKFDHNGSNGCFAEAFHRHQYGALGLIAATQVSYSFVNDVYVWGVYDNMWPDFMPTFGTEHPTDFILPSFGNASGKYFLRQSSWTSGNSTKEITYYLFHHHGDAYLNVYSEIPQKLSVDASPVIAENTDSYTFTATEGSTVCLSVNGEIIGLSIATGEPQTIQITPQNANTEVLITVTKQNYYRYNEIIPVISTSEPFLILEEYEILDDNNNNQLDFNEIANLNIDIHNVGYREISNINLSLSSESPYVEILNNNTTYNSIINVNDIATINNAFEIKISDSVPDNTTIYFTIEMSNDSYSYTDIFYITAFAPDFTVSNKTITDLNNNPINELQKGEKAKYSYFIKNQGHSNSTEVSIDFNILAPFVHTEETPLTFNTIHAMDSVEVSFIIEVDSIDCPDGAILTDIIKVTSGRYFFMEESQISLGNIVEDFENEELNTSLSWNNTGSKPWIRDNEDAFEGEYCFRATSNSPSSQSKLMLGIENEYDGKISFYFKSSDEDDELTFYIDNTVSDVIFSEEWQYVEYDLPAGNHLIKWIFKNSNEDGFAKIDLIKLPARPIIILQEIIGDHYVYLDNSILSTYSVEFHENAEYHWSLEPENAGTIQGSGHEINIEWNIEDIYQHPVLSVYADEDGNNSNVIRTEIFLTHTSVDEFIQNKINIYPNPANGEINIEFDDIYRQGLIEIFNSLGQKVYENSLDGISNNTKIDISHISSGTYLMRISQETNSISNIIIIQH